MALTESSETTIELVIFTPVDVQDTEDEPLTAVPLDDIRGQNEISESQRHRWIGEKIFTLDHQKSGVVSNGLGAGFAGVTLLAVLLGLTTLLAFLLGGVVVVRRRNRAVPPVLKYASAGVVLVAVGVAGFALVALYDEAAALAGLFVVIVLLPLAIAGGYLQRRTEVTRVDLLATIGLSWSLPFMFGVFVVFGITAGIGSELGLATTAAQQESLAQLATVLGGVIVVGGAVILSPRISRLVSSTDPS